MGDTTFIASSAGGLTFTGQGTGNTLELGSSTGLLTIDADNLVVEGLQPGYGGATTDTFSDIQTFEGNIGAGGTTFLGGPGDNAFEGEGTGTNTLSYAASTGSVTIDAATGTAQNGFGGTDSFSDIQSFVGSERRQHLHQ
jgi:hypothetical protein